MFYSFLWFLQCSFFSPIFFNRVSVSFMLSSVFTMVLLLKVTMSFIIVRQMFRTWSTARQLILGRYVRLWLSAQVKPFRTSSSPMEQLRKPLCDLYIVALSWCRCKSFLLLMLIPFWWYSTISFFSTKKKKKNADWVCLVFSVDSIQIEQYIMEKSLLKRCNDKLVSSVAVLNGKKLYKWFTAGYYVIRC